MRGICQRCHRVADLQKHHVKRRVNDPDDTVMICYECHHFIHMNPALAKKEGFYKQLDSVYIGDRK